MKTPRLLPAFTLALASRSAAPAHAEAKVKAAKVDTIEIAVTSDGFSPSTTTIKKGQPVKLVFTRKTDATCAKAVVFPELKIEKALPLNTPIEIAFTPKKSGDIKYGCAMGQMVAAVLHVE